MTNYCNPQTGQQNPLDNGHTFIQYGYPQFQKISEMCKFPDFFPTPTHDSGKNTNEDLNNLEALLGYKLMSSCSKGTLVLIYCATITGKFSQGRKTIHIKVERANHRREHFRT